MIAWENPPRPMALRAAVVQVHDDPVDSGEIATIGGVWKRKTQALRLATMAEARLRTDLVSSGFRPAFMRLTPNFCSITSSRETKRRESMPSDGRCVSE